MVIKLAAICIISLPVVAAIVWGITNEGKWVGLSLIVLVLMSIALATIHSMSHGPFDESEDGQYGGYDY